MLTDLPVESVGHCLLCGDSRVHRDARFERLLGLCEPYGVLRCTRCGLAWLSPRPTAEGYRRIYTGQDYFGGAGACEDYTALVRERRAHFRARLIRIERAMGRPGPLDVFEIGAAQGDFLDEARLRGHRVAGVEFSADARAYALGHYGLALHDPDTAGYPDGSYDAIHMNHVLEHLPDPLESLRECHRLLRPSGLLVIEVPQQIDNDLDGLRRALGLARQPVLSPYSLHHTYFFRPGNLSLLVERAGFRVVSLRTASPGRTPLWPPSFRNLVLRILLGLSDRLRRGGNIIEIVACPRSSP